jgi:uncharacterized protein YqgC (DUF456 family)
MPWRHVENWPAGLTAIHAVHLRNNRVMMWGFGVAGSNTACPAWVLNLLTLAFVRVDCTVNNFFARDTRCGRMGACWWTARKPQLLAPIGQKV